MPPVKKTEAKDESPKVDERPEADGPRDALNIQPGTGSLCRLCYPDGWPDGAVGLGCQHGSWTRTPTGLI